MEPQKNLLSNKKRISKLTVALRKALQSECEAGTTNITNYSNLLKILWSTLEDIDVNEIVQSLDENEVNGLLGVLELVNVHQLTNHLHQQQCREMNQLADEEEDKQTFASSSVAVEDDNEPCSSNNIAYKIQIRVLKPADVVSVTNINSQDTEIVAESSENQMESEVVREQVYNLFEDIRAQKVIAILETTAKERKSNFPFNIKLNTAIDYVRSMEFDDLVYLLDKLELEHSAASSNFKNTRKREHVAQTKEDHTFLPKRRKIKKDVEKNINNNLRNTEINDNFTKKLKMGFVPIQESVHPNVTRIKKPECFKYNDKLSSEISDSAESNIDSKYREQDINKLIENIKTEYCLNNYSKNDSESQGFNDILEKFTYSDILSLKKKIKDSVGSSSEVNLQMSVESLKDVMDTASQSSDDSTYINLKRLVSTVKFSDIDDSLNETIWQKMFKYVDNFDIDDSPKTVKKSKGNKNIPKLLKNSVTDKFNLIKYKELSKLEKPPKYLKIDKPKLNNIKQFHNCALIEERKSTNTIDLLTKLDKDLFKKTQDMINVLQQDKKIFEVDLVKKCPTAMKKTIVVDSDNTKDVDTFEKFLNNIEDSDPKSITLSYLQELPKDNKKMVRFLNIAKYEKIIEDQTVEHSFSKETNNNQIIQIKNKNLVFSDDLENESYGNSANFVIKDASISAYIDDTETVLPLKYVLRKNYKSLPNIPAYQPVSNENNVNVLENNAVKECKTTMTGELESYNDLQKNLIELDERELQQLPHRIESELLNCSNKFDGLLLDEISSLEKAPLYVKVEIIKLFLTKINLSYPGISLTAQNTQMNAAREELDMPKLNNPESIDKKSKKSQIVKEKMFEFIHNIIYSSGSSDEGDDHLPISSNSGQLVNTDATQKEDLLKSNHDFGPKDSCYTTDKIQTRDDYLLDVNHKPSSSNLRHIKKPETKQEHKFALTFSDSCDKQGPCQILDTDKAQHNDHAAKSSCSIDEIKTVDEPRNNNQPEYVDSSRSLSEAIENITQRTAEITISNSTENSEGTQPYTFKSELLEMIATLRQFINRRLDEE